MRHRGHSVVWRNSDIHDHPRNGELNRDEVKLSLSGSYEKLADFAKDPAEVRRYRDMALKLCKEAVKINPQSVEAKRALWAFVELGFLAVLAIILTHLLLGEGAGSYVTSVADNVLQFANGIPAQGLVGLAIVLALVFLITNRMK